MNPETPEQIAEKLVSEWYASPAMCNELVTDNAMESLRIVVAAALRAKDERIAELEGLVKRLSEWDQKNPKGRIYPIGPNDVDKQLDAICDDAAKLLRKEG